MVRKYFKNTSWYVFIIDISFLPHGFSLSLHSQVCLCWLPSPVRKWSNSQKQVKITLTHYFAF